MKKLLSIIGALFLCVIACGQVRLSGKVLLEESNLPIEGVTVKLNSNNGEMGTFTNREGQFNVELLRDVEYTLMFSAININDYQTIIKAQNDTVINIILTPSSLELDAVSIEARKKLMESKIDRLVYNVNNDPLAKNLTTEELIKRIPLLRVRDNSISIIGKGSVVVSINGKLQQISASELLPFLNNFDPSNLKSIEIITAPPSNFSAEGNAGIINIVTKQPSSSDTGHWNASVRSAYSQRSLPGTDNGLTFNYNKSKFSASANVNYTLTQLKVDLSSSGNGIQEDTDREDKGNRIGTYVNLNYKPSNKHDISGSFNYYNSLNENEYTNSRFFSGLFSSIGNRSNEQSRLSADLNYIFKIDSIGKRITAFISYNSNLPKERFNSSTVDESNNSLTTLLSTSDLKNSAFSSQIDIHFPYRFGEVDFGVQYYSLGNDATMEYVLDKDKSAESYLYNEYNYAGYASFSTKDIGKFRFKAGLRYEYNIADLEPTAGNINLLQRRKGKLFPTIYGLYSMENGGKLSINYTRRINRPTFSTITPFRYYHNIYTYVSGNPLVQPFISDNIQLNYSKGDLYLSLYSQLSKNGYGEVDIFNDQEWVYTYQNYFDQNRIGLTASYFMYFLKWWETDLYGNAYFNDSHSHIQYIENKKGHAFTYEISNRFFLNEGQRYMVSLNYWQDLPFYDNNVYNHSFGSLDLGANISLLDKKLNIGLLVTDIANQSITKTKGNYIDYSVYRRQYYDARIYRLSFRYNFGSSSVKAVRSNDKFQDRERIN